MSAIQWTDHTSNPIIGCSKVSAGCTNCYASDLAASMVRRRLPVAERYREVLDDTGTRWNGKTRVADAATLAAMKVPRRKREIVREFDRGAGRTVDMPRWRPARIFLGSMTDMFHETLGVQDLSPVFHWMAQWGGHHRADPGPTWQIVTKRPHRALEILRMLHGRWALQDWPRIHLLTSTEDQAAADERIPWILQCRPFVDLVGLSMEPLLGPVVLRPDWLEALSWAIIGGESGPRARPCHLNWIADLVRQCEATGTAVFVKQTGAIVRATINGTETLWPTKDPKGGDPHEWPRSIRVREFPT